MAGVFAMVAGAIGGRGGDEGDVPAARRAGSYEDYLEAEQAAKKSGIKSTRVQKIQLNRSLSEPCDVFSWFEVTLQEVNVPAQQFECSIEIHCFWQDYSLPVVFPEYLEEEFKIDDDNLPIKMTEIFENQVKCDVVNDPIFKYIAETSCIYMMFVVEVTFVERLELQRFPLDRQFLGMEFNAYSGVSKTGNWNWTLQPGLEWVPEEFRDRTYSVRMLSSIAGEYDLLSPWINFKVGGEETVVELAKTLSARLSEEEAKEVFGVTSQSNSEAATASATPQMESVKLKENEPKQMKKLGSKPDGKKNQKDVSRELDDSSDTDDDDIEPLKIMLRVNRRPHYYYGNIVFPNFLIGIGSGAAFIVPADDLADRLGVLITLMLAAVAFRFVVSTMLPRVTYLTLMDKYLLFSFIMIIFLIGENALVATGWFGSDAIDAWEYSFVAGFYMGWVVIHLFFVITLMCKQFYRVPWGRMYLLDSEDEDEPLKADDYHHVTTPDESEQCVQRWAQYKEDQKQKQPASKKAQ